MICTCMQKPSVHSHTESFVSLPALYMQNPYFTLRQCLVRHYQQHRRSVTIISKAKLLPQNSERLYKACDERSNATFQSPPYRHQNQQKQNRFLFLVANNTVPYDCHQPYDMSFSQTTDLTHFLQQALLPSSFLRSLFIACCKLCIVCVLDELMLNVLRCHLTY